jgi:phosphoribosylformylglycinamidine synthase II
MSFDAATLARHNLTQDEYDRIVQALGRDPNLTELGLYSVMWSEHCSYKSSRLHLKKLPTKGPRVVQGPGENAGAVDIGDGLACVFKIESHNHPSFIEPYQGAATGVGGIIRDIFTMGARPIALLNSLRFGSMDSALTRRILEGVVSGIAGYGNSIGIPTIGGEIQFDESYAGNPLVNVLCVGIAPAKALVKGLATGVGNPVYYVGAKTGRDGIHGATMASAEFDERSSEKRPAVQVGDPFMEKLLLEACLELMKSDAVVGVQDMGAAGLTCSTCEMGARAGTGIEFDVALVPQRETGMTPYEILLSESQERMLLVVKKGREREVEDIFEKWDLHAVRIGEVTGGTRLRVKDRGVVVADVPNASLVDEAPLYDRPYAPPADLGDRRRFDVGSLERMPPERALRLLLASPGIASKRWVYRQYDHMVRTNTLVLAGRGAGVVRVKGTNRAIAVSVDGNGRFCDLDPRRGAMLAVAESARNVACSGALPIGATNNLNFGNPERPDIMWQLVEAVEGIAEACRALEIPITGGNVSLYNETDGKAILPTPVLGVVGLIEDASKVIDRVFQGPGRDVLLFGTSAAEFGGSEYQKLTARDNRGVPPVLDLKVERALQALLVRAIGEGLLESAHDCSEGGLAVALAESCFESGGLGCCVDLPPVDAPADLRGAATLFSESATRVVASVRKDDRGRVLALARELGVPVQVIGETGGARLTIAAGGHTEIDCPVSEAENAWSTGLARYYTRTHAVA